ncbi:MAG: hypothetical protein WDW36_003422 [Sanguina aurantia]
MNAFGLTLLVGLLWPAAGLVSGAGGSILTNSFGTAVPPAPSPPSPSPSPPGSAAVAPGLICGFQGPAGTTQNFMSMSIAVNGIPSAGAVSISTRTISSVQYFVINIAFNASLFVPVPSKTVIQYTFLEGTSINVDYPRDISLQVRGLLSRGPGSLPAGSTGLVPVLLCTTVRRSTRTDDRHVTAAAAAPISSSSSSSAYQQQRLSAAAPNISSSSSSSAYQQQQQQQQRHSAAAAAAAAPLSSSASQQQRLSAAAAAAAAPISSSSSSATQQQQQQRLPAAAPPSALLLHTGCRFPPLTVEAGRIGMFPTQGGTPHRSPALVQAWSQSYKSSCNPASNGLYYFTKFGEAVGTATPTLNNGTVVSFPDAQSMQVLNPVVQSKLPWTNNGNSSAMCLHMKPGGVYLIVGIYNKGTHIIAGIADGEAAHQRQRQHCVHGLYMGARNAWVQWPSPRKVGTPSRAAPVAPTHDDDTPARVGQAHCRRAPHQPVSELAPSLGWAWDKHCRRAPHQPVLELAPSWGRAWDKHCRRAPHQPVLELAPSWGWAWDKHCRRAPHQPVLELAPSWGRAWGHQRDTAQPSAPYPNCGYNTMPETAFMPFQPACSCPQPTSRSNPPAPTALPSPPPPHPPTPSPNPNPPSPPPHRPVLRILSHPGPRPRSTPPTLSLPFHPACLRRRHPPTPAVTEPYKPSLAITTLPFPCPTLTPTVSQPHTTTIAVTATATAATAQSQTPISDPSSPPVTRTSLPTLPRSPAVSQPPATAIAVAAIASLPESLPETSEPATVTVTAKPFPEPCPAVSLTLTPAAIAIALAAFPQPSPPVTPAPWPSAPPSPPPPPPPSTADLGTCLCLPYTPTFVADPPNATYSAAQAAADTTAWTANRRVRRRGATTRQLHDETACISTQTSDAARSTASDLAAYTAAVAAALDTSVSLALRMAATSALAALEGDLVVISEAALALAARRFVAAEGAPGAGTVTSLNVVQVAKLVYIIAQSDTTMAVAAYNAAVAVNQTLAVDVSYVVAITTAQAIMTAGHRCRCSTRAAHGQRTRGAERAGIPRATRPPLPGAGVDPPTRPQKRRSRRRESGFFGGGGQPSPRPLNALLVLPHGRCLGLFPSLSPPEVLSFLFGGPACVCHTCRSVRRAVCAVPAGAGPIDAGPIARPTSLRPTAARCDAASGDRPRQPPHVPRTACLDALPSMRFGAPVVLSTPNPRDTLEPPPPPVGPRQSRTAPVLGPTAGGPGYRHRR